MHVCRLNNNGSLRTQCFALEVHLEILEISLVCHCLFVGYRRRRRRCFNVFLLNISYGGGGGGDGEAKFERLTQSNARNKCYKVTVSISNVCVR